VAQDGKRWHRCRLNRIHHKDSVTEGVSGVIKKSVFLFYWLLSPTHLGLPKLYLRTEGRSLRQQNNSVYIPVYDQTRGLVVRVSDY
jgi:ribosomal protein L30/L7E